MKRHLLSCLPVVAALLLGWGCKQTLESGYSPRALNDPEETRRAYYAPPFSPEAQAAPRDSNQPSPIQPGRPGR